MGLFDVFSPTKRAEKATAEAAVTVLTAELEAAAPREAQVSANSWSVGFTTYVVSIPGTRREMSALVGRLGKAISGLGRNDDLELRIAAPADSAAVSSLRITGRNRDPEVLAFLVRTHDELLARFPGESVLVDGSYGCFTVSGVARDDAVPTARLLVTWWEEMLAADLERWPISEIALDIGGTTDEPEISYAVELGGDEDEDAVATPVPLGEKQKEARQAIIAWTASLDDLEALTKVRLRSGYAARFGFTPTKFKPRLVVEDLETGDEDEDEAAEVLAGIHFHHPASKVKG